MTERNLKLRENDRVTPCPKCGNNTRFTLHAEYCAEDCCETFVVCKCGYEATGSGGERYENTWGEMGNDAALVALDCWNYALARTPPDPQEGR